MADPYRPAQPGQTLELSAKTLNGWQRAGRENDQHKMDAEGSPANNLDPLRPPRIYNGLGAALDPFIVLGFGAALVQPHVVPFEASSQPVFAAALPAAASPFCITREPIPAGGLGDVITHGPAVVRINVSDAAHTRAKVSPGINAYLVSSADEGVPILAKESGTGLKMAQVLLGAGGDDPDASPTVRGYMNTTTQSFAGVKTFRNIVRIGKAGDTPYLEFIDVFGAAAAQIGCGINHNLSTYSDFLNFLGATGGYPQIKIARAGGINTLNGQTTTLDIGGTTLRFVSGLLTGVENGTGLPPVAAFSYTPLLSFGPAPLTRDFIDSSTGGPTSWHWDFGDGNTSIQQNPFHTWTTPGYYTVTLTVTNDWGSDQATADITVEIP